MSTLDLKPSAGSLFTGLEPQPPDTLLSLIALCRDDPRASKIDLGVGVYRDQDGTTPIFQAVKAAEVHLAEHQPTKAYLGPEGDLEFLDRIRPLIFGDGPAEQDLFGVQTPGGTGALRLAAELAQAGSPGVRIWLGTPTWPNHAPLFARAGLTLATYRYFDPAAQSVCFDEMMTALGHAEAGDLVLLHGCCHNPTGADLDLHQWQTLADLIARRGLVPLVDLAYQGLGQGLEPDAASLRLILDRVDVALVAYSFDKNFGLYRERTGALFARARGHEALIRSNILMLARCAWSMPPDHGAAVVRTILESNTLSVSWRSELETMRMRLVSIRQALSAAYPPLAALGRQNGMFALIPLSPTQVDDLRREAGIYMTGTGRINLAGLNLETLPAFVRALDASLQGALI